MNAVTKAAARLQQKLSVPVGGANTIGLCDPKGAYIRVLLDPSYIPWKRTIPRAFEGYRVIVDTRNQAVAGSR